MFGPNIERADWKSLFSSALVNSADALSNKKNDDRC